MAVTTRPGGPSAAAGCVGADPGEAAAVRGGWRLVLALEQLRPVEAARAVADDTARQVDRARAAVADLVPWPSAADGIEVDESDTTRLRFLRLQDFLAPGDRVLDIGLARGYQTGVLVRDTELAAYHGMDVGPGRVRDTAEMLEVNGLTDRPVTLAPGDLFDLTAERLAELRPGIVLCSEVLEHTPDPERGLEVIAEALPAGAEVLFSIPMFRRLEQVWGHVTAFNAARVMAMLERAGLYAHHVEPIANLWTHVLASRDPGPSERARRGESALVPPAGPVLEHREFTRVDVQRAGPGRWQARARTTLTPAPPRGMACDVHGDAADASQDAAADKGRYGGLALAVHGLFGVRLDLELPDPTDVSTVYVDGYAGRKRVARWSWPDPRPGRRTVVLRPRLAETFTSAPLDGSADADALEVFLRVRPGTRSRFVLHQAAVLA